MPNSVLYRLAARAKGPTGFMALAPALFAVSLGLTGHAAEKLTAAPAVKKAEPAVVNISIVARARSRSPDVFDFFQIPQRDRPSTGIGS